MYAANTRIRNKRPCDRVREGFGAVPLTFRARKPEGNFPGAGAEDVARGKRFSQ